MAIHTVTCTFPTDAAANRMFNALSSKAPIPLDAQGQPLYTKAQWAQVWFDRMITRMVSTYETAVAKQAVAVAEDPNLVSVTVT